MSNNDIKKQQILTINKNLLDFVDGQFKLKITKREAGFIDVSVFLLAKSTKTFRALNILCDKGFGQDAAILVRSILENLINLAYIEKNESQHRAELFIYHSLLDNEKKLKKIKDDPDIVKICKDMEIFFYDKYNKNLLERISKIYKTECKKIEAIGKSQRKNSWSCLSIGDMAIEVKLEDLYYKKAYWLISQFAHSHVGASNSYFKEKLDGEILIVDNSSGDWVEESLTLGFDCYLRFLYLINKIFKLEFESKIKILEKEYLKIFGKKIH